MGRYSNIDKAYVLSYNKYVKSYEWDEYKNAKLKKERGVSFEQVNVAIQEGKTLDIIDNPNKKSYPSQKAYIIEINDYAYIVPYVEDKEKRFLKTIFPSRKMTKKYLEGGV